MLCLYHGSVDAGDRFKKKPWGIQALGNHGERCVGDPANRKGEKSMQRLAFRVGGKSMTDMNADHTMERKVISYGTNAYCHELAEILFNRGFGSIPIVDHERILIGLVSEYDILNALMKGMDLRGTLAQEVMTQPAISVREDTPIADVITLLQSRHLIRVPVVDHEGKLSGIIARRDILKCYIKSRFGPLPGFRHNV